jgi:signal peptidase I
MPAAPPQQPLQPTPNAAPPKHEGVKSIISTVLLLLIAPLIALVLTMFIFQSYEVDGQSMETTLQNHDRLIVLKVPRTWAGLTGHAYIPHRGDIVIFSRHGLFDSTTLGDKQLIKRVIALPGERVVIKDGVATVFNDEHPGGFVPDKTLPYGSAIPTTNGNIDLTIPAGEVFVLGDNRGNSIDSRIFGTVSSKDIVGKLAVRVFPFSNAKVY